MAPRCFICGNYRSNTHPVFTCPDAGEDYLLWCKIIPALSNHVGRTMICSRHFNPKDIVSVRAGNMTQYALLASALPCDSAVQVSEAFIRWQIEIQSVFVTYFFFFPVGLVFPSRDRHVWCMYWINSLLSFHCWNIYIYRKNSHLLHTCLPKDIPPPR